MKLGKKLFGATYKFAFMNVDTFENSLHRKKFGRSVHPTFRMQRERRMRPIWRP